MNVENFDVLLVFYMLVCIVLVVVQFYQWAESLIIFVTQPRGSGNRRTD